MLKLIVLFVCASLPPLYASLCKNPEISSASTYTTQDGMVVAEIAFISEFNLDCSNKANGLSLFGEVNGKILPIMKVDARNKYQVSWTEEIKKARSGDYIINVYDEEGYSNIRKAIRSGEDPKAITPLTSVTLNYSGTYLGPWVNSEFLAAILLISAWYVAFVHKSKLLS
ncbi:translocon-associated protein subunit delta-like [Planococcus citri]|uniref:translocon-associated protein subunit delta-like n=1 Tax=Planococcus citri TaxID=170843 RepID=UPI0031F914A5